MQLDGLKVLVVEDDPVFRQLVSDYCSQIGLTVSGAEDGQEALERFHDVQPDLVLVDLCMPRMGGLELLKVISRMAPEIPSIVITGNKAMSDVVEALRLGAWDYLMKPLADLAVLKQAIIDCLRETGDVPAAEQPSIPGWEDPGQSIEMADNFEAIKHDTQTASLIQAQLFPASRQSRKGYDFGYNLFKSEPVSDRLCDGFECGEHYYCAYLARVHPGGNLGAFVSVIIRSFFNQKLKRYRQGGSEAILEPYAMLGYLNEQLVKSGLGCTLDIAYLVFDQRTRRVAIGRAGNQIKVYLRSDDLLSPLALPQSPPIGQSSWGQPNCHYRDLGAGQALVLLEGANIARDSLMAEQFSGLQDDLHAGACLQLKSSA
ncbi:response regulator receiver protein [Ferrimonas balearica DSM 9799]|uniref:Response regulator receiver protein n=1 Tax=Ferrimonas balearica (strain DSM 9799 / CCM 4581 / KCTC 23876 / PAT) TaxID=550540 RepID=E1SUT3_FERBD|nr:response regulator [Ferrimonas balearica]ADN75274.1 response regulator receiver protein [Ferrimonas balearica DSM 9799]MBW3138181.1 response regulator [Ferrimonas balearica]MBW3164264.1 response regulator [Ferrimonas balearica]MBY5978938.1 response regulator [Ferrimonas balearica]MBY6105246.1 response regulator [Ferrimonas balearica]